VKGLLSVVSLVNWPCALEFVMVNPLEVSRGLSEALALDGLDVLLKASLFLLSSDPEGIDWFDQVIVAWRSEVAGITGDDDRWPPETPLTLALLGEVACNTGYVGVRNMFLRECARLN